MSDEIVLDYSKAKFTHPFYTLGVVLVVEIYKRKSVNISINGDFEDSNIKSYMDLICFPNGVNPIDISDLESYFKKFENKTYLQNIQKILEIIF
jgi:hypothetical protein